MAQYKSRLTPEWPESQNQSTLDKMWVGWLRQMPQENTVQTWFFRRGWGGTRLWKLMIFSDHLGSVLQQPPWFSPVPTAKLNSCWGNMVVCFDLGFAPMSSYLSDALHLPNPNPPKLNLAPAHTYTHTNSTYCCISNRFRTVHAYQIRN